MKRVFNNQDLFKILRALDNHSENDNIGLAVLESEIALSDIQQIYKNGWTERNHYYLILGDINQFTIKTLMNCAQFEGFLTGVGFDCKISTERLIQLRDICNSMNVACYTVKDKMEPEQLQINGLRVVDTIYDV